MNPDGSRLTLLSILDARVVTGPARGLIHLARHLPEGAWLHVALLSPAGETGEHPLTRAARGTRMTTHRLVERGSYDAGVVLRARDLALEVGAHVVQSHSYKPHVIGAGVRALTGLPWVGFHHGWTAENLKLKLFHALDRFTLPRADRIVAVSRSSEHLVLGVGCPRARTVMITNAVDPQDLAAGCTRDEARAKLGLPPGALIATAVGRLSHEKGQDVFLRAFTLAARQAPALHVALAGDGPDRAMLEQLATELGVRDRVHFLGHQGAVGVVYAASDIAVLPSRSEGMPNALLEAMCLGVPAVAANVGGVSEVATDGETAWIVPPERPDALARALVSAAVDPTERARRAAAARAHVQNTMSPARRAERFVSLYEDLLGRPVGQTLATATASTAAAPQHPGVTTP